MLPQDTNVFGNLYGDTIMRLIDNAGTIAVFRHTHRNIVTGSEDRVDFLTSVYLENLVSLKVSVNYMSRTFMEVGVQVEVECLLTGTRAHCESAFLIYVEMDEEGNPSKVPKIIPES